MLLERDAGPGLTHGAYLRIGSYSTETAIFDLHVLVDAVLGSFAAQPRLLDAAERGDLGRYEPLVDPDHAHLELLGDPPDLADVLRVEVARQPDARVVSDRQHLGLRLEPAREQEGTKRSC